MWFKGITLSLALIGLAGTLVPRIPGLPLIFLAAVFYGTVTAFVTLQPAVAVALLLCLVAGELGGRWLRVYLTRCFHISRRYSTDSLVSSIAGVVISDALLGSLWGIVLWELCIGKSLLPSWHTSLRIVAYLAGAALWRFTWGLAMIAIIVTYIF